MYGEIKIGGKTVPMLSMASTDIYYKRIFREDALKVQSQENVDLADMVDMTMKMGYIMAMFAQLKSSKEMSKLNEDTYIEWLDGFEREDYYDALEDIRKVYEGQRLTTATEKKQKDE